MAEINQIDFGDGVTRDLRDTSAVKWTQAEGYVGKNKLIYPYVDTTKSANGVEFTDKGNGSVGVKITNSATARTVFFFKNANSAFSPKAGRYKLYSGSNNANITVAIDAYNGATWVKSIIATDGTFALDYNGYDRITVFLAVANGTTAADITITPMIYDASIGDPAYVPYVPSNSELDKKYDALSYVSSGLTVNNGTLQTGGYCKIGNLVIVNIRVKATTSNSSVTISGLPTYSTKATANLIPCACSNFSDSTPAYASVLQNGNCSILSTDVVSDKVYVVSAVYLCD